MKRVLPVVAVVVGLGIALGCSGMPMPGMGGGHANKAACKKWVEAQNALPCMKIAQQDAAQICPDVLDQSPTDMTEYYGCMEKNAKCNGEIPDLAGQVGCTPSM